MKLLIVTQTVDRTDPILGFFHGWIAALATQVASIEVIGLQVGEHDLPENVTVHSLGKERGPVSTWRYAWRLHRLAWRLRSRYDVVFAHMNPEYVLAGGLTWSFCRVPITMWYAHGATSWRLRVVTWFCTRIFTSTASGYRYDNHKREIVGQGIDVNQFTQASDDATRVAEAPLQLITVGRITPAKQLDTLIHAVAALRQSDVRVQLTIVGVATTSAEQHYQQQLEQYVATHDLSEAVQFAGAKTQSALPAALRAADIFVNDGATGSLDKALLEAMAAGCMVISSNESFTQIVPTDLQATFASGDVDGLVARVMAYQAASPAERQRRQSWLRDEVVHHHSLQAFAGKITSSLETII